MYYIRSFDNNKIAVYDLNPYSSKTILFVHGWPLSHKIFEYQLEMLLNLNYRVISIDLRGFGNSDTTANGYDYTSLATDLYNVILNLKLHNIILVGFSMGGAIVCRYMYLYKNYAVSKLCLIDAAVPSFTKTVNNPYGSTIQSVDSLINQALTDRPQMNEDFGNKLFASNPSESFRNWFQDISNSASGVGTVQTAISLRDEDLFYELPFIHAPTGIFHGKLDEVCSYEFAKIQNKYISNSTLFTFEHSGHVCFYDELERFNKTFSNFIR